MGRLLATLLIGALLALDFFLPRTSLGRRGSEAAARQEVPGALGTVGQELPDLALQDLDGRAVRLSELRGKRLLITFERSVDW